MWDRGASAGASFIRLINNSRSPDMAEESTQRQVTSLLVPRSGTLEFLHFRAPKGRPIPAQANECVKKSLVAGSCGSAACCAESPPAFRQAAEPKKFNLAPEVRRAVPFRTAGGGAAIFSHLQLPGLAHRRRCTSQHAAATAHSRNSALARPILGS